MEGMDTGGPCHRVMLSLHWFICTASHISLLNHVQAAYSHLNLVRQLEVNYRSTPQILAVGRAMLTNSGLIPKDLQPTISGEGKPPVRLLVLDTEEHEARVIAQVSVELISSLASVQPTILPRLLSVWIMLLGP